MSTIYLVILGLALAATLMFAAAWLPDRYVSRRPAGESTGGGAERQRWDDGTVDQLLVTFPVAAGGLLLGLVLSGAEIDLLDLGPQAMLLAAGVTATERLVARRHADTGGRAAAMSLVLCVAAGAGVIGGIAELAR